MEIEGLKPSTSALPALRSNQLSYIPIEGEYIIGWYNQAMRRGKRVVAAAVVLIALLAGGAAIYAQQRRPPSEPQALFYAALENMLRQPRHHLYDPADGYGYFQPAADSVGSGGYVSGSGGDERAEAGQLGDH